MFALNLFAFMKTKQIIVAFVATTLKPLLSVAKTNGRFSRSKLYTADIYYFFQNIITHILPLK